MAVILPILSAHNRELKSISVEGTSFALNGKFFSYRFHVDATSGDLISDHFGGHVTEDLVVASPPSSQSFALNGHLKHEFPVLGNGNFRTPAVVIKHGEGFTVSNFKYQSHTVLEGKPAASGLPATFGEKTHVATLVVHMIDIINAVAADLIYSVFPEHDAIVRSVKITNNGTQDIVVEKLASFSIDLPLGDYDMLGLRGEWGRERTVYRRRIDYGTQGFGSSTGFSSHSFNPFFSVIWPTTTETQGDAWGFSLIYSGSFTAETEKSPRGLLRASIGVNSQQLSWNLKFGESLASPECVAVYSNSGLGGMSRKYHRLYRQHLIKSKFVNQPRPTLLNSWEGLYFNIDENRVEKLAKSAADLGIELFVLDDGWFGVEHPRLGDNAGLGDWRPNPVRFPNGINSIVHKVNNMQSAGRQTKLKFGLWFEPEMVNLKSELYEAHPDWVMSAGNHPRTTLRNQLILNLALPDVQDYIINSLAAVLISAPIAYIKWDTNRGIHESSAPRNFHSYMLGLYRVFNVLTSRFPDVLWEGCSAGGARFDAGILHYFPQIWTSDNMDPIDRLSIQHGTSLVYPPSTISAHIGTAPNHVTSRSHSLEFRAHVAMMGGSFGLELDPDNMPVEEKQKVPGLIALAEKINPIVIKGDLWRLSSPEESNHPAYLMISEDGCEAVLFVFQLLSTLVHEIPITRLQGLNPAARYKLDLNGEKTFSGSTLMNGGIQFDFKGDYESKIVLIQKIP